MAKYEKDRKFYWLQLKEDFFEEGAIDWLEEQENGVAYSHFYLKLCLKSLRDNGILIRKVGNVLIPYDAKKLAEITKTDIDTVIVAMELLKKIGLVKVFESGEIYLTQIESMIGSKSIGAFKKQQQRQLKKEIEETCLLESTNGGQMSEKCPPKIEREIELEKEIDIEIERDEKIGSLSSINFSNEKVFKHFEKCGILISTRVNGEEYSRLLELISADVEIYGAKWLMDAADLAVIKGKYSLSYVEGILRNWKTEGRKEDKNGTTSEFTKNTESEEQNYNFNF